MRAGNLRHPVTIQEKSVTADDYGGGSVSWVSYASARAAIWPQKGKEVVVDGKVQMFTSTIIRIRYQAGITSDMRVLLHDGRIFEIINVRSIYEKGECIDLMCKEYE